MVAREDDLDLLVVRLVVGIKKAIDRREVVRVGRVVGSDDGPKRGRALPESGLAANHRR